ncbi:fimbria/pilus periplasmic chaperone [Enterobacter bugandensis]|nr:fimbria/pilus periplasmic chaperone [Enterobacter bugandensis]
MKHTLVVAGIVLMLVSELSQAGLVIGGTRLLYDAKKYEVSLKVTNTGDSRLLVQS